MFGEAEDGRGLRLRVAANPLKDGRAVVNDVAQDMNLGLFPGDEGAVVPDVGSGLNGHEWIAPG